MRPVGTTPRSSSTPPTPPLPPVDREVGIDLGLTRFGGAARRAGASSRPRASPARRPAKLRTAQRELARRQKGSANRGKSRRKVARAHARVADTRRDWLHKLSTTIIRENQAVYVEDLAVSGLARTRLAPVGARRRGGRRSCRMLAYKAHRAGRTFVKVDRWFPSTRACSACGAVGEAKPLHVRTWTCGCRTARRRDVNAARNILAAGRAVMCVCGAGASPHLRVRRGP